MRDHRGLVILPPEHAACIFGSPAIHRIVRYPATLAFRRAWLERIQALRGSSAG